MANQSPTPTRPCHRNHTTPQPQPHHTIGAAGLALGLVQGLLPSLRELNVSANCLSAAGVVRIVSALETNCRSSSEVPLVNLSFNLLPEERGAVSHSALPQGVLL